MLYIPGGGNSFGAIQSNATERPAAAQGTSVTPASGSKGSWTEVFSSMTYATYGLLICINNNNTNTASRNTVLDVGVGGAGSEAVLIPDLICGNAATYTTIGSGLWYYFPVAIPAGVRLSVRSQSTVTTAFNVYVQAMQRPANPAMLKVASYFEAIGSGSLPSGTSVTAGTTSDGSWTLLGTTTNSVWWWQIGVQVSSADTAHQAVVYHVDLAEGDGTNYRVLLDSVPFSTLNTEMGAMMIPVAGAENAVAPGKSIYVRAQCSGTTDPLFITAYGGGG